MAVSQIFDNDGNDDDETITMKATKSTMMTRRTSVMAGRSIFTVSQPPQLSI